MNHNIQNSSPDGWCRCEKKEDTFAQRSDLYVEAFLPDGWWLQYGRLDQPGSDRFLYLMGWCIRCRGRMRSGVSIPGELTGDDLLEYIYNQMRRYRPFSAGNQETGRYATGYFSGRTAWYREQDDLPLMDYNKQFLSLFHWEDQKAVWDWLDEHHREEPYTRPRRDRKSTLLEAILERARADGSISGIEPILDYYLPNPSEPNSPDRDTYLTDYEFDIVPAIMFGSSEGIYVDVYLEGKFDGSDCRKTSLATFKTLDTSLDACRKMGELCGILMYHGSRYVNQNIHRYTPQKELEAEYARKMAAADTGKEGEQT